MQTDTADNSYNLSVILVEQKLKARRIYKRLSHLLEQNILNTQDRIVAKGIRDYIAKLKKKIHCRARIDRQGIGILRGKNDIE